MHHDSSHSGRTKRSVPHTPGWSVGKVHDLHVFSFDKPLERGPRAWFLELGIQRDGNRRTTCQSCWLLRQCRVSDDCTNAHFAEVICHSGVEALDEIPSESRVSWECRRAEQCWRRRHAKSSDALYAATRRFRNARTLRPRARRATLRTSAAAGTRIRLRPAADDGSER